MKYRLFFLKTGYVLLLIVSLFVNPKELGRDAFIIAKRINGENYKLMPVSELLVRIDDQWFFYDTLRKIVEDGCEKDKAENLYKMAEIRKQAQNRFTAWARKVEIQGGRVYYYEKYSIADGTSESGCIALNGCFEYDRLVVGRAMADSETIRYSSQGEK